MPNLFGSKAPGWNVNSTIGTNLTNRSNADVAAYFTSLFNVTGQKAYAQVLASAFAVFTTNNALNTGNVTYSGTTSRALADKYGFTRSNTGAGAAIFTVHQADWHAFALGTLTATQSVAQLLTLA